MIKELSDKELETYSRQIVLADIGYDGQLKLRNARATIIGMGGLGSQIALKLVAMGIGHLRIVDRDVVSRSDLHRQYLYDADLVGLPKVEAACQKLHRLNPDVTLEPIAESLNSKNAGEIMETSDVVLDGLDRPEPRYIINRTCNTYKMPYVFGAAIEAVGNVTSIIPGRTLCLECFMPGLREDDLPKCAVVGVHTSVIGIVTAVQVSEAVRILIGQEPKLTNKLLYIDLREMQFHCLNLSALENCPVCGDSPAGSPEPVADALFEETCARDGRRNFIISPRKRISINLEKLSQILKNEGYHIKTSGKFGITFEKSEDITVCMLNSGIMITQTAPRFEGDLKKKMRKTYKSLLIDGMGLSSDILP
ncbi:MAG: HesA/MoeB/ThiF family protein [Desulfobacterales bacterium]|jgi:adenylyltransferase/sulfurtransferase